MPLRLWPGRDSEARRIAAAAERCALEADEGGWWMIELTAEKRAALIGLCWHYRVARLELFGSAGGERHYEGCPGKGGWLKVPLCPPFPLIRMPM